MKIGVLIIIMKSQIARLTTKMLDGVCKDLALHRENVTDIPEQ